MWLNHMSVLMHLSTIWLNVFNRIFLQWEGTSISSDSASTSSSTSGCFAEQLGYNCREPVFVFLELVS